MTSKIMQGTRLHGVPRLKVSDFPREGTRTDFGVRSALVKAFNYCRQHPAAMDHLAATLRFTLSRIDQWNIVRNDVETALAAQGKRLDGGEFKQPLKSVESAPAPQEQVAQPLQLGLEPVPTTPTPVAMVAPEQTVGAPLPALTLPPLGQS